MILLPQPIRFALTVVVLACLEGGTTNAGQPPDHTRISLLPGGLIPNQPASLSGRRLFPDNSVCAFLPVPGGHVLFTPDGPLFCLISRPAASPADRAGGDGGSDRPAFPPARQPDQEESGRVVVLSLAAGGAARAKAGRAEPPRLAEPLENTVNYFIGPPEDWQSSVPVYRTIVYPEAWPGIDLEYHASGGRLEYRLRIRPGIDPAKALLAADLADMSLDAQGGLTATLEDVTLRTSQPEAWQELNGEKQPVGVRIRMAQNGTFFFAAAAFDPERELIIASSLSWSTMAGAGQDRLYAIAVDGPGCSYVTGYTTMSSFPVTPGAWDTSISGAKDVVVTKLNAAGSALVYSTFLGGSNYDEGCGIAVDGAGCAYVAGYTQSSDFPATAGSYDTSHNGSKDIFVTKLNAAGNALVYSTFIGAGGGEGGQGIAVDGQGNAYIGGWSDSVSFPVTPEAFDLSHNGGVNDVVVVKLSANGSSLLYSTFIGGNQVDQAFGIAVDGLGRAYLTGSTSTNFPVTAGAYDISYNGGGTNAFVARLAASGSALDYSTYLGKTTKGYGIATDGTGCAVVTGEAYADFPVTAGAYDTTYNGMADIFVAKLTLSGTDLIYSTYLGGSEREYGYGIAIDGTGCACVTGWSYSTDYPVSPDACDPAANADWNTVVTKLDQNGQSLVYSTYMGGDANDRAYGIAADGPGNVYVTGYSSGAGFPTTDGAFSRITGGERGFVFKLGLGGSCDGAAIITEPQNCIIASGQTVTLTVSATGTPPLHYQWYEGNSGDTSKPVGSDANSFTTAALTANARYWARVTNGCGTANSKAAMVECYSLLGNLNVGGYLGIGTESPLRAIHIWGPGAVFRMDRSTNTAAFMIVRTNDSGGLLKTFVVGANAAGANNGSFVINDLGAATSGSGTTRLTITNTGDAIFGKDVRAAGFTTISSRLFKTDIQPLTGAPAILDRLQGYRFKWRESGEDSCGLIAEEAAAVLPALATFLDGNPAGIDYSRLAAVLLEGVKAQQARIEVLKQQRIRLQALLDEWLERRRK